MGKKQNKYHWKKSYTLLIALNAVYLVLFYLLMRWVG
jgi:uncharacterized protein YpmS